MQTENLYFLLICAISENFEGKIGGIEPKNQGNPKHFGKKKVGLIGFWTGCQ